MDTLFPGWVTAELRQLPIVRRFLTVPAIQRLQRIAFLGAIDCLRGGGFHRSLRAGTRLEHTLGVVELAYFATRHLSAGERMTAVAAAMVHDIGHGPLSHSTESFFQDKFGMNHKTQGINLIETDPSLGHIFSEFHIDIDRICRLVFCNSPDPLSYLFSYPVNIDTLEGITRTARFFKVPYSKDILSDSVDFFIDPNNSAQESMDKFFILKKDIYNNYIFNSKNAFLDALISHMLYSSPYMRPDVFSEEDSYLTLRYAPFYGSHVATCLHENRATRTPKRYYIDVGVRLDSYEALALRYRTGGPVHAQEIPSHPDRH